MNKIRYFVEQSWLLIVASFCFGLLIAVTNAGLLPRIIQNKNTISLTNLTYDYSKESCYYSEYSTTTQLVPFRNEEVGISKAVSEGKHVDDIISGLLNLLNKYGEIIEQGLSYNGYAVSRDDKKNLKPELYEVIVNYIKCKKKL